MTQAPTDLTAAVEGFLTQHGMEPTRFGRLAVNDPKFVFDLREGREPRRATRDRVVAFMHGYSPEPTEATGKGNSADTGSECAA